MDVLYKYPYTIACPSIRRKCSDTNILSHLPPNHRSNKSKSKTQHEVNLFLQFVSFSDSHSGQQK